jgi:hypothetical protein
MADTTLTLTADECDTLVRLLEETLKATRIEEHRTRVPSARQVILKQEDIVASILRKLGKPPV